MDLLPSLEQNRQALKEIIQEKGIIFKKVKLSSKKKSNYYYDIKSIVMSEGVNLIGELMLSKIKEMYPDVKSVGGLEFGAIPVTTAIVFKSNQLRPESRVTGFFVRKERKEHGLQKKIEGNPRSPLLIVDDVVTTGKSVIDAIDALIEDGLSPTGIISVIDREDERNKLKKKPWKYDSLFKHSEFADYINSKLENAKKLTAN